MHGNRYLLRLAGVWKKYGGTTCKTLTSLLVRFLQQRKMFNNKAIRKGFTSNLDTTMKLTIQINLFRSNLHLGINLKC